MDGLHLAQANEWLGSLFAGWGQVAFVQRAVWAETSALPAWALFLSALVLLVAGLWLYYMCIRGMEAARRSRWLERQVATKRAEVLLREHLSDHQYRQLLENGYLEVCSRLHPGRAYRIPARLGRVAVYEAGCPVGQLCVIAGDQVPQADLILAQKWLIEADERAYLALANWIGGPPPRRAIRGLETRRQQPL
jgi:hypothetical protein